MKRKFFNIISLLVIMTMVQGCEILGISALLGGGAYYVGAKSGKREDERIKTQALIDVKKELDDKAQAQKLQDQAIQNTISQNYMAGQLTNQIAIYPEVRNGVVILHGRVPDAATAQRAIEAARKAHNVQRIISNLVITNQPRNAVPLTAMPQFQGNVQQMPQGYPQLPYQPIPGYPQMQYQQQPMQYQPPQQYQMQPMQPLPPQSGAQPVRYQQQSQNKSSEKKSQIAKNAQPKASKQSPPPDNNKNTSAEARSKTPEISKESPKKQTPKTLPENIVDKYSDDNDSEYKEYKPRKIAKKTTPAPAPQSQKQIIYVPVPVPVYQTDNDELYRGVGQYSPNRLQYHAPAMPTAPMPTSVPSSTPSVPTPTDVNDYDGQYYSY